ncbi:hypothetical protein BOTBODRAFT_47404 [Botryobasidium botryosum FD-172 SS1]|uniref:Uncharacterized protein n=1 Tax=Botryobasidium botryosum (strain FD-172 SS1) TaxID=930990 RepID=A0A067MD59_BOTB1|nr:hypothetical protein BOTBODRAFT_47404 [Botryobasidium botryosum FD-172 SS1]
MSKHIVKRNPVKQQMRSTRLYATQKDKAAIMLAQRTDIRKAAHKIRADEHEKVAQVAHKKQVSVTRVQRELGCVSTLKKKTCAPNDEYQEEYREMSKEKLEETMAEHEAWREREKLGKHTQSKEQTADIIRTQKKIKDTSRMRGKYSSVVLNNTDKIANARATVRKCIDEGLAKVMLDPPWMEYSHYQELMVLEKILATFESGECCWEMATPPESAAGGDHAKKRKQCSDAGIPRKGSLEASSSKKAGKKHKDQGDCSYKQIAPLLSVGNTVNQSRDMGSKREQKLPCALGRARSHRRQATLGWPELSSRGEKGAEDI